MYVHMFHTVRMSVLHFLQCDNATHNASRSQPEFDILMSPAVDQLTTDPLVELNGITYVLYNATYRVIQSEYWYIAMQKVHVFTGFKPSF